MPIEIGAEEVRMLVAGGAQLVEVLPREEYAEAHLPGATNIPLKGLGREAIGRLRRNAPVILYCHDTQ